MLSRQQLVDELFLVVYRNSEGLRSVRTGYLPDLFSSDEWTLPATRGQCALFPAIQLMFSQGEEQGISKRFIFQENLPFCTTIRRRKKACLTSKSKGTPRPRLVLLAVQPDVCATEGKNLPPYADGAAKSTSSAKPRCNANR